MRDMADPRAVPNLFTRKENPLRRNTRGSKWVSAKNESNAVQRPSPGKNITLQTQTYRHPSYSAQTFEDHRQGVDPHEQTPPIVLTSAVYDPTDLPKNSGSPQPLPRVRSWASLRPSVHEDYNDVSPRTSVPPHKARGESAVSPLGSEIGIWRDSAVSDVEVKNFTPEGRDRQESNATVFPSFPSNIKKTEDRSREVRSTPNPHTSDDFFHAAKAIYAAGPKGEGQKLWKSYKVSREAKQSRTEIREITRFPLKEIEVPQSRRPSNAAGLSAHPTVSPPNRPPPSQVRLEPRKAIRVNEHLYPRKPSDISDTSCEVPLSLGPALEDHGEPWKPLPPYPKLQAAPKSRRPNDLVPNHPPSSHAYAGSSKPLPSAPHPLIPPSPKAYHTNTSIAPAKLKDSKASHWWRSLAEKTSESYIPTSKANADIKISRPRPITALQEGRTANIAAEHGGVGGPGAYGTMSDKAKGKQKAHSPTAGLFPKHWSEKRKRDSDVSFACVGVDEGHAAFVHQGAMSSEDFGPSRDVEGHLRPDSLFSGTRGGAPRDTKFYGPVHEVLDEY